MKATTISHDAFARFVVIRVKASKGQECAWCGAPARWHYGTHADGIFTKPDIDYKHAFCSIGCKRIYDSD